MPITKRAVDRTQTALQKKKGMVMSVMIALLRRILRRRPITKICLEKSDPIIKPRIGSDTSSVSLNSTFSGSQFTYTLST